MKKFFENKIRSRRGITRAAVVLLIAIAALLVAIIIPVSISHQKTAQRLACVQSLDSGTRQLYDYYLAGDVKSVADAKAIVTYAMNGWDDLCPAGGTVHIVYDEDAKKPYFLICGLHGTDKKQVTRLNALYVLESLRDRVEKLGAQGIKYPETIDVKLNSKTYTAVLVDEESGYVRGTYNTPGAKEKTVIFYSIKGHGDFGSDSGANDGEIWYFSFADENHCANWNIKSGWSGDSYAG